MVFRVEVPDDGYFRYQVRCQDACPVGTDARGYVRAIADGDFERAYLIARGPNPLASICGRVCGAPCEAACRRGLLDAPISIRALKRTATERFGTESGKFEPLDILRRILDLPAAEHDCEAGEELRSLRARLGLLEVGADPGEEGRVAIIGSGPAGLACAHDLALLGHRATVIEMEREPAGMLVYGIPEYRLPRDLVRGEVDLIRALGVEFRCNTAVGVDVGFDELLRDFDAVVIAVGAKNSRELRIPGMEGPGVVGGVEFLREAALGVRPDEVEGDVVVIGGGNVAYDVARTALRQVELDVSRSALRSEGVGAVTLVSLESLDEMPADDVEILEGEEEGLLRLNSLGPVRVERGANGRPTGVLFQRCVRVFDEEGKFAPLFDEADTELVPCDTVLLSIGQTIDVSFVDPKRDGVEVSERGFVTCDPVLGTSSRENVFVAGDCAYGPQLLIHGVASGKRVAREVHRHLTGATVEAEAVGFHGVIEDYAREADYEKIARAHPRTAPAAERVRSQAAPVEEGFDEATARREASRCFDCGVNTVFDGTRCVLCGGCVDVCPESCLKIVALERVEPTPILSKLRDAVFGGRPGPVSAILKDEDLCIRCALCAERCPNEAITMERFCFGARETVAT